MKGVKGAGEGGGDASSDGCGTAPAIARCACLCAALCSQLTTPLPPPPLRPARSAAVPTALLSLPADYLARRICSSTSMPSEETFMLQHKPL